MSSRGTRGLSLLELVVSMALFALIAVMGLQLITGTLRMRDRLEVTADNTAELSLTLALLRADLQASVPLLFFPPDGGVQSAWESGRNVLSFSIGGQQDLPPVQGLGLHRVTWRITGAEGQLSRQIWSVLVPANASAQMPAMQVMTGVQSLSVRSFWPEQGWQPGVSNVVPSQPVGPEQDSDRGTIAQSSYSGEMPLAVELTLQTATYGEIVLMESLQ